MQRYLIAQARDPLIVSETATRWRWRSLPTHVDCCEISLVSASLPRVYEPVYLSETSHSRL